jgi:methylthioribose-1-phosphate isomerase
VKFVRRNPVVAVAAALGVGVLAYAAHRKRKRDEANAPIEGRSKRIEPKRVSGTGKARKTATSNTGSSRARKTAAPSAET